MPQGVKGGFPTYWTEFGSGPREALLIHCSLGHSGAWAGMAAHLGDILHMTAFDTFPATAEAVNGTSARPCSGSPPTWRRISSIGR